MSRNPSPERKLLTLIFCGFLLLPLFAQNYERTFEKTLNPEERALSAAPTADGGFILTGETAETSQGERDILLLKANALGLQAWKKTFGQASNDAGLCVIQTKDLGFLVCGVMGEPADGSNRAFLLKTDASGKELWRRTLGYGFEDAARQVVELPDGKIVVAGNGVNTEGWDDLFVTRLGADGTIEKTTNTGQGWTLYALAATADGSLFLGTDYGVTKIQPNGNFEFSQKTWTSGPNTLLSVKRILLLADNSLVLGGASLEGLPMLVRIDASGKLLNSQVMPVAEHAFTQLFRSGSNLHAIAEPLTGSGASQHHIGLYSNQLAPLKTVNLPNTAFSREGLAAALPFGNTIVFAGTADDTLHQTDIRLLAFTDDSYGKVFWKRRLGTVKINPGEEGHALCTDPDGNTILSGMEYDPVNGPVSSLIKLDPYGQQLWKKTYDLGHPTLPNQNQPYAFGLACNNNGSFSLLATVKDSLVFCLISNQGTLVWKKVQTGPEFSSPRAVLAIHPGGGWVAAVQRDQARLLRYDISGNLLWERKDLSNSVAVPLSLLAEADGNIVLAGRKRLSNPDRDVMWVRKMNASGELLWDRTYSDAQYSAVSGIVRNEYGYVICGPEYPDGISAGNALPVIRFLDPVNGDLLVEQPLESPFEAEWRADDLDLGADGSLYLLSVRTPVYFSITDPAERALIVTHLSADAGSVLFEKETGVGKYPSYLAGQVNPDASFSFAGRSYDRYNDQLDYYVGKISQGLTATQEHTGSENALQIFPNPVSTELQLQTNMSHTGSLAIRIRDLSGKVWMESRVQKTQEAESFRWQVESLPPAVYILECETEGELSRTRFVKR